jgi:hypothetical protein
LAGYAASPLYSEAERVALEYADGMTLSGREVSDELFARLRAFYDDDALVELTAIIAWENASSKSIARCGYRPRDYGSATDLDGGLNSATTGRRPPHLHRHLDPRPEPIDDPHKAIDRKTVQVRVADTREIRCRNAGPIMRLPNAQALAVERLDNLGGQERLELPDIRIRHIQVSVDVSAPADNFKPFPFHRNISFNRFSRSLISSISRCGVSIPCVDFSGTHARPTILPRAALHTPPEKHCSCAEAQSQRFPTQGPSSAWRYPPSRLPPRSSAPPGISTALLPGRLVIHYLVI